MKFIHTADIHLGSKIENLPNDIRLKKKSEVRASFMKAVEYAKYDGVSAILISGDLFDSDTPSFKDKDFFINVVLNNPDIDFLYLKGNHDISGDFGVTLPENLKTFSNEWTYYDYGNVTVAGIEICKENSSSLYSTLSLDKNRKNIVMLHGEVADNSGLCKVNLLKLKDKNIDYLALGHYHDYLVKKLDDRGVYAYSGCLEGRGFDEFGKKGFVVLNETEDSFNQTFIENEQRLFTKYSLDVSNQKDAYSTAVFVKDKIKNSSKDIVRVEIYGEVDFDNEGLEKEIETVLSSSFYYLTVKNKTVRKFDLSSIQTDASLKGEFMRLVLADETLSNEQKNKIITVGLKALSNQKIDE